MHDMHAYPRYLPRYPISDMKNPRPIRSQYLIFRTLSPYETEVVEESESEPKVIEDSESELEVEEPELKVEEPFIETLVDPPVEPAMELLLFSSAPLMQTSIQDERTREMNPRSLSPS